MVYTSGVEEKEMTLKVVEREDWFTFGKNAGLSGDQMDLIIEQVDDIVKHSEKDFHPSLCG